jgi:hypothetical protein
MQIPLLNGIFTDSSPDVRTSYPVNLVPVPKASGVSNEYLRPADGLIAQGTGPGTDRGGINWNGVCYRVMGSKLVTVSSTGAVTILGDVGDDGKQVTLDYSFTLLGIASNGNLFFWDPATSVLTQNVDPDLGVVLDVVWVDGYWMTTDGEFLVVTELTNPLDVNPLKYGSSEVDPDPVVALLKLRNEIYALNRHTIEVFDNIGGDFFPFGRIDGAQIEKGCVGTHACCNFIESIAFLGGGMNEAPGIYLGGNASAIKISTQEVDEILALFTETQLSLCKLEARNDRTHLHLYVHLPDRTLVYDASASEATKQQIWFTLTTTLEGFSRYRAQNWVWCFDKWLVADPLSTTVGYATDTIGSHWGQDVRWEFGTLMAYNGGKGAVVHELELAALTGAITYEQFAAGFAEFTTPGAYSWTAPAWLGSATVVCVGGGGGSILSGTDDGQDTSFGTLLTAGGGTCGGTLGGVGGTGTPLGATVFGGDGGDGADRTDSNNPGGGGGAGGYSGNGGNGGNDLVAFTAGTGGAAAGGAKFSGGGGVGILGEGASGTTSGQGGSGGTDANPGGNTAGVYGGGAEGRPYQSKSSTARGGGGGGGLRWGVLTLAGGATYPVVVGAGGGTGSWSGRGGAVRISWPGKNLPRIFTSYSLDGQTWSQEQAISIGGPGDRSKRLVWRRQGFMRNFRMQRFRGDSAAHVTFLRIEAQIEALAY